MTLMLVVMVVGLPLLAWLADLALLDAAATRSRIERLVRDVEDPP
jgi:predicted metal-binding membrane protein